MKRYNILFLSLLGLFTAMPVFAQDDEDMTEEETPVVKKEKKVVLPTYPTMEVKGICVDAATKTPLAGIMVRALGNANYTAMTDDNGEFVIKVPTFTTALYVHTPEYLSQQVGIGPAGRVLRIEMLPDSYRPMYTDQTDITAQASQSLPNTHRPSRPISRVSLVPMCVPSHVLVVLAMAQRCSSVVLTL